MLMAIIRKKEMAGLTMAALGAKLGEVRRELNTERGLIKSGGRSSNPGKIKELRRTIARILTKASQKESMNAKAPSKTAPAKKSEVKISA
jgi:large subunit ribosomal protein L29